MIRLIQRRLIIPRGDTGDFTIPLQPNIEIGNAAVFTIFDPMTNKKVWDKLMTVNSQELKVQFTHADTVNLPVGNYVWDIKFYQDPTIVDGKVMDGIEVDSYYAAFKLPACEIRQTGDALLTADDAPTTTLEPNSLNALMAAVEATNVNREEAENSASAAGESAASAALSANETATMLEEITGMIENIPTNVSEFENDAGYITSAALPTRISDLTDDSGHYTKPVGGIPASDLANGVLDIWSGLTYHTSTMSTDSDSFVLGGATDAPTEINKCLITSTPGANVIPKFDYQGRLHSVTPEDEWDGSNAVATTEYVDNMISDNIPEIPTNVSELNNDVGYLTSFTETDPTVPSWAKAPTKPTYTAAEVGAPTVAEMQQAIFNVNTMKIHICTVAEYNSETGVPTIVSPDTQTFYLVPGGEGNNLFIEWVYV